MDHIGTVDIFESAQNLVKEELAVLIGELLIAFDDCGEIGLHQLRDHVNVFEVLARLGKDDSFHSDDILMFQEFKEAQLSECSLRENFMFEGLINLLDSNQIFLLVGCLLILSSHHNSVSPLSNCIDDLVSVVNLEFLV